MARPRKRVYASSQAKNIKKAVSGVRKSIEKEIKKSYWERVRARLPTFGGFAKYALAIYTGAELQRAAMRSGYGYDFYLPVNDSGGYVGGMATWPQMSKYAQTGRFF